MKIAEYSGIGRRIQNQDFILSKSIGENKSLFIVADGMGGYSHGDLAARTVAEGIFFSIFNGSSLQEAVKEANQDLQSEIIKLGNVKMGCCLAGLLLENGFAKIFWVGDSRIYQFRNGVEVFRTQDHTLISEMEKYGPVSYERRKKYGHVVTRAMMGAPEDEVDTTVLSVEKGDEFLICSDGIYNEIPIDVLLELIRLNTLQLEDRKDDFDDNHSFIYIEI